MCIRPLLESFRHQSGIELDVCPTCRGAWFDRGELEQLLDVNDSNPGERRTPAALIAQSESITPEPRSSRRRSRIFHEVKDFFD